MVWIVLPCTVCIVLSWLIFPSRVLSGLTLSCLTQSCPVLPCLLWSCFVWSCWLKQVVESYVTALKDHPLRRRSSAFVRRAMSSWLGQGYNSCDHHWSSSSPPPQLPCYSCCPLSNSSSISNWCAASSSVSASSHWRTDHVVWTEEWPMQLRSMLKQYELQCQGQTTCTSPHPSHRPTLLNT